VLRDSDRPVGRDRLTLAWHEPVQRERALDALVADGLVERVGPEKFALPGLTRC
jgi:A/G-specific adenine glycosylase